jgi:hypothetical protein
MPKIIRLKAQEKAIIYKRNFSSVPTDICFDAVALDGSQPMGEVEVRGSYWVFSKPAQIQPSQSQNQAHAGFWDTFFSIKVVAYKPVEITFTKQNNNLTRWLVLAIAALVAIAALIFWLVQ